MTGWVLLAAGGVLAAESSHGGGAVGWALLAAVALLIANAVFVGYEFALIAARRTKLEPLADEGNRRARTALRAMSDLRRQLALSQLGITMASLGLGATAEPAIAALIDPILADLGVPESAVETVGIVIALSIVVFVHIVLGEMVPKNLAISAPEASARWLAGPLHLFVVLFRPVLWFLNWAAQAVIRPFGIESPDELATVHSAREFALLIDASREEGLIEDSEHALLSGALDFGGQVASSIMIPRSRVVAVDRRTPIVDIERVVVESGHSRLPVLGTGVDDVLGFVHAKDLLRLPTDARDEPLPLELIRRMTVVPPDRSLVDLLLGMRRFRRHVALVRAPDGRTLGIVTLEDVLEELVGDIRDESDA